MPAAKLNDIKKELNFLPPEQLAEVCLRLSRYKKENKELLAYLLFYADDEASYVAKVKQEIDEQFETMPRGNWYIIKKSLRKILRMVSKFIRFSGIKQTEVELLIYFCMKMKDAGYSKTTNTLLNNMYQQLLVKIERAVEKLHEDLQYDYHTEVKKLV
jgi:hypothetical protein